MRDNQDEVGEAGSDPETSGPADLCEKAAKTTNKSQDSEESA